MRRFYFVSVIHSSKPFQAYVIDDKISIADNTCIVVICERRYISTITILVAIVSRRSTAEHNPPRGGFFSFLFFSFILFVFFRFDDRQ
mmetsp:Transcript_61091/g.149578  ORF Transcript_61091/g.149578 Transcript_61091/m.149578 type:complete len:88 (+) Transcript_61091:350-613(+)